MIKEGLRTPTEKGILVSRVSIQPEDLMYNNESPLGLDCHTAT